MNMKILKKSQIWYFDLILGISIFVLILAFAFQFISHNYMYQGKEINLVLMESEKLSSNLMSSGIPENWNVSNVIIMGVLDSGIINETKLTLFYNITNDNYELAQQILGIKSDYLIYFKDKDDKLVNVINQSYIGKSGYTNDTIIDTSEIINIKRFITYKKDGIAQILSLNILVWND
jgi:hypothetical protein